MIWETAPSIVELEIHMMQWQAKALRLPQSQEIIHNSTSTATLTAVLTMREHTNH